MSALVPIAFAAWMVLSIAGFVCLPARRAALASFVGAWLFLPVAGASVPGLRSKITIVCLGVFCLCAVFDHRSLRRLRPIPADVPIIAWCACRGISALANHMGAYATLSEAYTSVVDWGLPYVLGRVYFGSPMSLGELADAIVKSGLLYAPLCLFEIVSGPRLHELVYGYAQRLPGQAARFGGWRPMVFLDHGLMVGLWMAVASLIALQRAAPGGEGRARRLAIALLLVAVTVACKSVGAIILLTAGGAVLALSAGLGTRAPLLCLIAAAPLYVGARVAGVRAPEPLVRLAAARLDAAHAQSLSYRFTNEDRMIPRALERPLFGFGKLGRAIESDARRKKAPPIVIDGLWFVVLCSSGIIGVFCLMATMLAPCALAALGASGRPREPDARTALALATALALYAIDCVLNAMLNPLFMVVAGALVTWAASARARAPAPARAL